MAEPAKIRIRSFKPADAPACKKLYLDGIIAGKLADNDTGLDIDDIQAAYMSARGSHFWVAEDAKGQVVGMLGVQSHESDTAEIRRLRVKRDQRRKGIGSALMEEALRFCQDMQYLKVTLDTYMEREPAVKLFEKFRFRLSRNRDLAGKTLLYFYLDLYSGERKPKKT